MKQALPAIGMAGFLLDIAIVDELTQHAGQALLGNLKDVEKVGDRHAGPQIDKVQHAVMGSTKALPLEQCIRIAGKVAIGKEEQLDRFEIDLALVDRSTTAAAVVDCVRVMIVPILH